MGRGFSPLDEQLGLGPPHLSPSLVAQVVLLGTLLPFEQVPAVLASFTGVTLSAETARRLTETAGELAVALDTSAVAELERTLPNPPAGPPIQQLSVDGAMAPLVHGQWAEVKTLAIGTVTSRLDRDGLPVPHTVDLSYFSRLTDADSFGRLATVETHARGTETAGTVVAVVDGAVWCQGFIDLHRPDAVRILDGPHALGYLAMASQACFPDEPVRAATWLADQARELLTGDADTVLDTLQEAQRDLADDDVAAHETLAQVVGYLQPRRAQLDYVHFQALGYPIGSGIVESANKLVVEARLKGSGMHWAREHVNPLVALRCRYCSGRWMASWPAIWAAWRTMATAQRADRRQARQMAVVPESSVVPAPPPALPAAASVPLGTAPPRPKLVVNGKPTKDHPWRTKGNGLRASA